MKVDAGFFNILKICIFTLGFIACVVRMSISEAYIQGYMSIITGLTLTVSIFTILFMVLKKLKERHFAMQSDRHILVISIKNNIPINRFKLFFIFTSPLWIIIPIITYRLCNPLLCDIISIATFTLVFTSDLIAEIAAECIYDFKGREERKAS